MFYFIVMVRTRISSKGQTTIPSALRKKWKAAQVLWDISPDGTARVSPAPDLMSLLGSASHDRPRDPDEKKKARHAIGREAAQEGRSK
jgi:bifunctional DNA-binding transcriptional regulator/antitoxin component of YhaV-PrlF toxin-antitoxin module